MALSAKLWGPYTEVLDEFGSVQAYGDPLTEPPVVLAITGEQYAAKAIVQDNYSKITLWTENDGGLESFIILFFESDQPVLLELTRDLGGTPTYTVISVFSNQPIRLTSNDIHNSQLSNGSLTTLTAGTDDIERIAVKRNVADGIGDANVRLVLWR